MSAFKCTLNHCTSSSSSSSSTSGSQPPSISNGCHPSGQDTLEPPLSPNPLYSDAHLCKRCLFLRRKKTVLANRVTTAVMAHSILNLPAALVGTFWWTLLVLAAAAAELEARPWCEDQDRNLPDYTHGRIIQCAQCARAHEAPPHWRPHHQANIAMLKFVIEVKSLKCIKRRRLKRSSVFTVKKNCAGPTKTVHTLPR